MKIKSLIKYVGFTIFISTLSCGVSVLTISLLNNGTDPKGNALVGFAMGMFAMVCIWGWIAILKPVALYICSVYKHEPRKFIDFV